MNYKLLMMGVFSVVCVTYFFSGNSHINGNVELQKPLMNSKFQPLLTSNLRAFDKATDNIQSESSSLPVVGSSIPKSLEGIDLDIALPIDSQGNLIIGMELKDLFEIYLSAMGEEELEDILLRIQKALAVQLSSPALEQGYDALKRFIDYKIELANLEQNEPTVDQSTDGKLNLDNIRRQKEILANIQNEYFTPLEREALFAQETEYDEFMLSHLSIQEDETLSLQEKQQQVEALEATLPEDVKQVRETAMAPAKVYQQAQTMRAEGKTEAEIHQMRSQVLGEGAATALAELDQQRAQWQQRLDAFKEQQQSISSSGLSLADQQTELEAVISRDFNGTESIRVRALTGL